MFRRFFPLALVLAAGCLSALAGARGRTTVTPAESDAVFANPGMGWQTFHRFADEDRNLEGIPSSSAYFRFYWRELEPVEGRINYAFFDSLLARAHKAGQKLSFRVMCVGTDGDSIHVPLWLKESGCPGFSFHYGDEKMTRWVPDMDHPRFKEAHYRFIRELGKRYDGHPDLDLVDIGTVGLWGEWHMGGTGVNVPSPETRDEILDLWIKAFPRSPKAMLIGDAEGMRRAVIAGCGWRADCLGDMGGFSKTWNHMDNLYRQQVELSGARDAWKTAPVAFESCWTMQKWSDEGWDIDYIFNYGLDLHASFLNNKSAKIPEGSLPRIEAFLRRLGYRFVLRKLEHAPEVRPGAPLDVALSWENTGVAPPYLDYRLAFRLTGEKDGRAVMLPTGISLRGWLPGAKDITVSPVLPRDLRKGTYTLSLAVLDPVRDEPAVRLAIEGRAADGWYPLSTVTVR